MPLRQQVHIRAPRIGVQWWCLRFSLLTVRWTFEAAGGNTWRRLACASHSGADRRVPAPQIGPGGDMPVVATTGAVLGQGGDMPVVASTGAVLEKGGDMPVVSTTGAVLGQGGDMPVVATTGAVLGQCR